jgi:hypothetical protein
MKGIQMKNFVNRPAVKLVALIAINVTVVVGAQLLVKKVADKLEI